MVRTWVVEPLPNGWCRAWEVVSDGLGGFAVGPEVWAPTAAVLCAAEQETAFEIRVPPVVSSPTHRTAADWR